MLVWISGWRGLKLELSLESSPRSSVEEAFGWNEVNVGLRDEARAGVGLRICRSRPRFNSQQLKSISPSFLRHLVLMVWSRCHSLLSIGLVDRVCLASQSIFPRAFKLETIDGASDPFEALSDGAF